MTFCHIYVGYIILFIWLENVKVDKYCIYEVWWSQRRWGNTGQCQSEDNNLRVNTSKWKEYWFSVLEDFAARQNSFHWRVDIEGVTRHTMCGRQRQTVTTTMSMVSCHQLPVNSTALAPHPAVTVYFNAYTAWRLSSNSRQDDLLCAGLA